MMKRFLRRAIETVVRVVRRFLSNQPANGYEEIAFNAVRLTATRFGRVA